MTLLSESFVATNAHHQKETFTTKTLKGSSESLRAAMYYFDESEIKIISAGSSQIPIYNFIEQWQVLVIGLVAVAVRTHQARTKRSGDKFAGKVR
jgi:hypothetical protein